MTVNEREERKKELRENLTLEEIIDLYLEDEQRIRKMEAEENKLRAELEDSNNKIVFLENTLDKKNKELLSVIGRHEKDKTLAIQLNTALDVMIEKYLGAKGSRGA